MKKYFLFFVMLIAFPGITLAQFQNEMLFSSQADNSSKVTSLDNQFNNTLLGQKRDPGHAMLMSAVWPGLGQFYNGPTETTKGTIMAIGQGGFLLVTLIGALNPSEGSVGNGGYSNGTFNYDVKQPSINPLVWIGLVGMVGNCIYSMIDANNRAKELNADEGISIQIKPLPNMLRAYSLNAADNLIFCISMKISL
jgi:TM2 domain-containing membrane protein YozV